MNKRSRNRSRHTTMLVSQLIERRNSRRIAQHHGDLTTTRNAGGLALGAGLGLHSVRRMLRVKPAHSFRALVGSFARRPAGERLAVDANEERAVSFGGDCDRSANLAELFNTLGFHGFIQSRPIPPMCESYAVTSDVSTPFARIAA